MPGVTGLFILIVALHLFVPKMLPGLGRAMDKPVMNARKLARDVQGYKENGKA